jgi:hypothetical protein
MYVCVDCGDYTVAEKWGMLRRLVVTLCCMYLCYVMQSDFRRLGSLVLQLLSNDTFLHTVHTTPSPLTTSQQEQAEVTLVA